MFNKVMELKINKTMSSEKGKRPLEKKETMLDVKNQET